MKPEKRIYISIMWIIIGVVLIGLTFMGKVDAFWNGMGWVYVRTYNSGSCYCFKDNGAGYVVYGGVYGSVLDADSVLGFLPYS